MLTSFMAMRRPSLASNRFPWPARPCNGTALIWTDTRSIPQRAPRTTNLFAVQLVADPAVNSKTIALLAPLERPRRVLNFINVMARLAPADLDRVAARPDVISIQPCHAARKKDERQDQIVAGNLSGNVPSGPGYLAWLASKGFSQEQFDASGFVVDVSDSGIDDGTTSPNHFGLYSGGDTNAASRVAYARLEGTPNSGSTLKGLRRPRHHQRAHCRRIR